MKNEKSIRLAFFLSSIFIFLLSTLSHFAFKWSNYNDFVGFFAPTNESVFQHLKMFFYPIILYYLITFLIFSQKWDIHPNQWFLAPLLSILITSFIVTGTYYMFQYGLNIESMAVDILSLAIGLIVSSIVSYRIYKYNKSLRLPGVISLIFILVLAIGVTYLDTNPQQTDLFYDHENKTNQRVTEK